MLEHTLPMSWAIAFRDMLTLPARKTANVSCTAPQEAGDERILPDAPVHLRGRHTVRHYTTLKGCLRLSNSRGRSMSAV